MPNFPLGALRHPRANVQGTLFRAEEAGYLAGYLAALMEGRRAGKHVISSVGGFPFYGVDRWIVGYKAGARKADPGVTNLTGYSQDFANPAKCRRVALSQIARGSGVVFNVAGGCGLGTLQTAKGERVWGIGVDIDQSFLGEHILTGAVIREDKPVFESIRRLVQGTPPKGTQRGGRGDALPHVRAEVQAVVSRSVRASSRTSLVSSRCWTGGRVRQATTVSGM